MNIASDAEYRNAIFSCQGEFLSKNRGDDRVYIPDQVEDKLDTGKAIFQIAAVEIAINRSRRHAAASVSVKNRGW